MKRYQLIKHLKRHGCVLIREGGRHSWWGNPNLEQRSAIPRDTEISIILAKKRFANISIPRASVPARGLQHLHHFDGIGVIVSKVVSANAEGFLCVLQCLLAVAGTPGLRGAG